MITVATLGAAYSANKGAASMLQAVVDNLPDRVGPTRFVAVSTHPAADRRSYARAGVAVDVASQRPVEMAAIHVPLALVAGLFRVARLPWRWACRPAALRALANADLVADLSGISFVDGRRFPVMVYNALVVMIPLLLGRPVVKCSQAMGPFRTPVNRWLAKAVLPRLAAVCPRGDATERHLREQLGLDNLVPAADLAFTMRVPDDVRERMRSRLAAVPGPYLVVSPSQVVDTYCTRHGIDYPAIMAEFIATAAERTGHTVVMIAHSAQPDAGVNHMNDLPLCREIYGRLGTTDRVVFFDEDLLPTELRAVISSGALLVTSRFHAMISALTERTPLLVIGWSHKYAEVLTPFGLADLALAYDDLTGAEPILDRTEKLLARRDELAITIGERLPGALAAAGSNFDALAAALPTATGEHRLPAPRTNR
jgi:polysaccharide pyruvyl transferase WcaK-like protein